MITLVRHCPLGVLLAAMRPDHRCLTCPYPDCVEAGRGAGDRRMVQEAVWRLVAQGRPMVAIARELGIRARMVQRLAEERAHA